MAAPDKGTERVKIKDIADVLEKYRNDHKQQKKDIFKTVCGFHDIVKQGKVESTEGKAKLIEIRKSQSFHHLPPEIQQWLTAYEGPKTLERKQGHEKAGESKGTSPVPPSAEQSCNESQGVDSGPAPVNQMQKYSSTSNIRPSQSNYSPSVAHKANNEKDREIANLKEKMKKLETELETEKKTVKEQSHILNDRKKQLEDLKKGGRTKDEKINEQEAEIQHLLKRFEQEQKIAENDLKSAKDTAARFEHQVNVCLDERQENRQKITELEASCRSLDAACKKLENQKNHIEQQAKQNIEHMQHILKEEKRKSDDQYKKLLAERDDLRDRFSKLAGKKLQEQNADIADLSDPNRAMKVSEKFGQLYDDDWTNAFESLTDKKLGVPLKDAINVLLRLLQECWTFCNKLVAAQMESLQNVFLHPAQNMANFDQKKTGLTDRPRITSKDQPSLNDLRKRVGVSPPVIEEVKQALLADSKTWDKREKKEFDKKHIEACTPYLQKCAEVCWLMALHDPPLVMKMDVKQGAKFDTNIYTVYSHSGQTIDFLVWPPLYNGRDGGLLSKGVAEPVKVVSKKK